MKAIGNNIIIRKIDEGTTTTKGGLLLAKNQREDVRYTKAIIVSVGDEASVSGLQQQDIIYFDRHAGHKIELDKDTLHIIKLQDIVVVK